MLLEYSSLKHFSSNTSTVRYTSMLTPFSYHFTLLIDPSKSMYFFKSIFFYANSPSGYTFLRRISSPSLSDENARTATSWNPWCDFCRGGISFLARVYFSMVSPLSS